MGTGRADSSDGSLESGGELTGVLSDPGPGASCERRTLRAPVERDGVAFGSRTGSLLTLAARRLRSSRS